MAVGSHALSSFPFSYEQFISTYNLPVIETYAALMKLGDEGFIQMTEGFYEHSKLIFLLNKSELYKFQVANPKLDSVIKVLLRLYGGGIFGDYFKIKEKNIGLLLKTNEAQVRKWLKLLNDYEVIDYQPSLDSPTIIFLTPRFDPEKLPIDAERIEWRKELAMEKTQSVIDYVQSRDCRTQIFQYYFGEETSLTCGTCDNDLEKRKQLKFDKIPIDQVEEMLEAPRNITELRALMSDYTQDQIIEALRILIEEKKVIENQRKFSLI